MNGERRALLCALALVMGQELRVEGQALDLPFADYTLTSWSEKDGLPSGRIRAMEQDADGYLWLGTDVGLVRFDGVRFVPWEALGQTPFPQGTVHALFCSRDGSLWIGLGGTGRVGRIQDGKLKIYGEQDGIGDGDVQSVLEDRDGTIWAGSRQGLYRFRHDGWERLGPRHGLSEGAVPAVYEDRKKRFWVATSDGVFRRIEETDTFYKVEATELSSTFWQKFSEDSSGTIWITDFQEGFRTLGDRRPRNRAARRRGWGVQVLHDRRGNLWVATQGQGLWRVRYDNLTQDPKIATITVRDGLSSDAVQSLLEDREGNLWVGTHAGLQRFSPRRVTPLTNVGLARTVEVSRDGSVWVGTTGGLVRFSKAGREQYGERQGLPGSIVFALHTDESGTLWISTERGLARFFNGHFSSVLLPGSREVNRIVAITSSREIIWFRDTYQRLFSWSSALMPLPAAVPDAYRRTALSVHADKSGRIWVGSARGGLGVIHPNGEFQSYQLDIGDLTSIYEDASDTLWLGGDQGLGQFGQGRFITVNGRNGFPGNIQSIAEDEQGFLWIGVGSGLVRLDRSEFAKAASDPRYQIRYKLFNTLDGVAGAPRRLGSPSAVRAKDGKLWFLTSSGVTVVDPRNLGEPRLLPPVKIESIVVDSQTFDPTPQLLLPSRTSHLQIVFTALTLTDSMSVRFRYRLEGFDDRWVTAGTGRLASYTNLPPRNYRFRVVASNADGTWNEPGAVWDFAIEPMFYQTSSFYTAFAVMIAFFFWASWRFRVQQVRRQFALVLAERIRISRTIHDTLLQGMVGIALQVDDLANSVGSSSETTKDHLVRIRRQVEDYVREARQSIWDLRSPQLEMCDLAVALRKAGQRAIAGRPVQFRLDVSGTPYQCPPQVEEQLLLIGQEALNNAVQHGQARQVGVELQYDDRQLCLRVSDDGCGFDLNLACKTGGHYGLMSMHERAEQVGGRLKIATTLGGGTKVEAVFPTTSTTLSLRSDCE